MSQCKANCGFFGQDKLNGYCSVCATNLKNGAVTIDLSISSESTQTSLHTVSQQPVIEYSTVSEPIKESTTPSRSRCHKCTKKVGLLGFECACSGVYCQKCRHAESHNCSYDYSSSGKALLQKNNPVVMGMTLVRMD